MLSGSRIWVIVASLYGRLPCCSAMNVSFLMYDQARECAGVRACVYVCFVSICVQCLFFSFSFFPSHICCVQCVGNHTVTSTHNLVNLFTVNWKNSWDDYMLDVNTRTHEVYIYLQLMTELHYINNSNIKKMVMISSQLSWSCWARCRFVRLHPLAVLTQIFLL